MENVLKLSIQEEINRKKISEMRRQNFQKVMMRPQIYNYCPQQGHTKTIAELMWNGACSGLRELTNQSRLGISGRGP